VSDSVKRTGETAARLDIVPVCTRSTLRTLSVLNQQRMIFQLADALNDLNAGNDELQVEFWEWMQTSPNTPADTPFHRPDGTIPGKTDVATNREYYNPPYTTMPLLPKKRLQLSTTSRHLMRSV
jgi:hypothetical protein